MPSSTSGRVGRGRDRLEHLVKRERREPRSPGFYATRRDVALLVAALTLLDTAAKLLLL